MDTVDEDVDALHTTWMRRTKAQWKDVRREDGADVYNALHPYQGVKRKAEGGEDSIEQRLIVLEKFLQRAVTVSISSLNADHIRKEGYRPKVYVLPSCDKVVSDLLPFEWTDGKECEQHDKYIPYFSSLLNYKELLDVKVAPNNMLDNRLLPIHLRGTTDAVITPVHHSSEVIGIGEWKKQVKSFHLPQLHGELISANLLFPNMKPFGVLSDLKDSWSICWIDGDTVYQVTEDFDSDRKVGPLTRNTAIDFLRKSCLAAVMKVEGGLVRSSLEAVLTDDVKVDGLNGRRLPTSKYRKDDARFVSFQDFVEQEEFNKATTMALLNLKDSFDPLPFI